MAKERKITLPLSADLLEKLANFQEIELQDVIIDLEEIELNIGSSAGGMNPAVMSRLAYEISLIRDSASRINQVLGGGMPTITPMATPAQHAVSQITPARHTVSPMAPIFTQCCAFGCRIEGS